MTQILQSLVEQAEAARVLQICNACRYCEGFCAVFPAMTRRLQFDAPAVHYLANLCHHCGACWYACQYADPHEFQVNVPRALAQVRAKTYAQFAWPRSLGVLYAQNGWTLSVALCLGLAAFLMAAASAQVPVWRSPPIDNFYAIFPHGLMVAIFLPALAYAVLALALGVRQFWAEMPLPPATASAVSEAAANALSLKYLDGGHGEGCHNEDDRWTHSRRRLHHLVMGGFLLCLASTSVATVYHYLLSWPAPYGWSTAPKVLGATGGVAMMVGCVGLLWIRRQRDRATMDPHQTPMDVGFVVVLLIVAASGMALALARGTPAVPALLCLHLGSVLAFMLTMPYSKFAHGVFRSAALLKWAIERRQPRGLQAVGD